MQSAWTRLMHDGFCTLESLARGSETDPKNPFDGWPASPIHFSCEFESESAAIEGAAAEQRGGRVLIFH